MTHKRNYFYGFRLILIVSCVLILDSMLSLKKVSGAEQGSVEVVNNKLEMLPLYWTIGVIGGCIALTLIFVGWRKYKAEKKQVNKKSYH